MANSKWGISAESLGMLPAALLIAVYGIFYQKPYLSADAPSAIKGDLDLSNRDFQRSGRVKLNGEWEFYWSHFIEPGAFDTPGALSSRRWVQVPNYWNDYETDGSGLPGHGYATYRLTVKVSPSTTPYALKIPEIGTAFRMFANGKPVHSGGVIGISEEEERPAMNQGTVDLIPDSAGNIEIVFYVSNFNHARGGLWYPIQFGEKKQIYDLRESKLYFEFFLFGSLFIMGVYHLSLYLLRRNEWSFLAFGALCLLDAVRTLITGEQYLLKFIPDFNFELYFKTGYIITFLLPGVLGLFLRSLFPEELDLKFLKGILLYDAALVVGTILFPSTVYTGLLLDLFIYQQPVISIYYLYVLLLALRKKRDGAKIFLYGVMFLFSTGINDMLNAKGMISSVYLLEFGFFIFLFSQAFLLSKRFSDAFYKIEDLSDRLIAADRIKDEFLANTSHELRTPLSGIIGLADSMRDGVVGNMTEEAKRNLGLVVASGRRLMHLINDILDFSRLKNRDIVLYRKPVDMRQTAEVVLAVLQPLAAAKKLDLVNGIPKNLPGVYADEERLYQILSNLVGNAIKFTADGFVRVSAEILAGRDAFKSLGDESAPITGRAIQISVQDSGIGIQDEQIERIFQPFIQADASSQRFYSGVGLGLSITRRLVELHQGTMHVESQVGKGSRFYFTLPETDAQPEDYGGEMLGELHEIEPQSDDIVSHMEESSEELVERIDPMIRNAVILVVDDEPIIRKVVVDMLKLRGFQVMEARRGDEALAMIESKRPDLVLLDIMMPVMNGYEVCERIRAKYTLGELPVILLSAKNQVSDMVHGIDAGANDYVTKPFLKDELFARIRTQIHLAKFNQSANRFIPAPFLESINKKSILDVRLGDHAERVMTVLHSEIRDFTAITERIGSKMTFELLNDYLRVMGPLIRSRNGFIDKYMGESILALFPSEAAAIDSAIEMRKKLREFNRERIVSGQSLVDIGIGISTGRVTLGTIGEDDRLEGTVIADCVNYASRLKDMTKIYGCGILIGDHGSANFSDDHAYSYRLIDSIVPDDKNRRISVFEIFDGDTEDSIEGKLRTKGRFESGVQQYMDMNLKGAIATFSAVVAENPKDTAALYYINRCEYYGKHGIPLD